MDVRDSVQSVPLSNVELAPASSVNLEPSDVKISQASSTNFDKVQNTSPNILKRAWRSIQQSGSRLLQCILELFYKYILRRPYHKPSTESPKTLERTASPFPCDDRYVTVRKRKSSESDNLEVSSPSPTREVQPEPDPIENAPAVSLKSPVLDVHPTESTPKPSLPSPKITTDLSYIAPTESFEAAANAPSGFVPVLPFDIISHFNPPGTVPNRQEISHQLDAYKREFMSPTNGRKSESRPACDVKKDLEKLNVQIFEFVKQQDKTIKTPLQFLCSVGMHRQQEIVPNIGIGKEIELEEGCYYHFNGRHSGHEKVTLEEVQSNPAKQDWAFLLKYEKGVIYLFLNEKAAGGIYINEQYYRSIDGRGLAMPALTLNPEDRVWGTNNACFLFNVLRGGKLQMPSDTRQRISHYGSQGLVQGMNFERAFNDKGNLYAIPTVLTTHKQAGVLESTIVDGFSFYPHITEKSETPPSLEDILKDTCENEIHIDLEQDLLLKRVVDYFKREFEIMKYTPEEGLVRLMTFVTYILDNDNYSHGTKGTRDSHCFYLSEYLKSQSGNCRHQAFLLKLLADQLGCGRCTLIASRVLLAHHAWNIVELNGGYWLMDCTKKQLLNIGDMGTLGAEKAKAISLYGLQSLVAAAT